MKYWASNFAIIPIDKNPGLANIGGVSESDWIPSGASSWMRCGEHHRSLFLQLLLGSLALVATIPFAQASSPKPVPSKNIALYHQPSSDNSDVAMWRCSDIVMWRCSDIVMWRCGDIVMWRCGDVVNSPSHPLTFSFPPLSRSNGAILAHQTTSIAKPFPTARNGVAARTPLPEAGERAYKMNHHFQICTKGYLAGPGIPVPASGLWVGLAGGNHGGKVERWKIVKGGRPLPFTHLRLLRKVRMENLSIENEKLYLETPPSIGGNVPRWRGIRGWTKYPSLSKVSGAASYLHPYTLTPLPIPSSNENRERTIDNNIKRRPADTPKKQGVNHYSFILFTPQNVLNYDA